jgi:membrane protein
MIEKIKLFFEYLYNFKYIKVIVESLRDFTKNDSMNFAAATAFYTIFSLPAFFILILKVGSTVYNQSKIKEELFLQVEDLAGIEAVNTIEATLQNMSIDNSSVVSGAIAFGIIAFSATTVFVSLQNAMNHIWHIRATPKRGFLKYIINRLLSFSLVLSLGFILIVSLLLDAIVSLIFTQLEFLLESYALKLSSLVQIVISQILLVVIFALMYKILPDAKVRWKDTWLGALVTAILFVGGKFGIGFYIGSTDLGNTYGAAGSLVILLIWVYYSVIIFLLGGQITFYIAKIYGRIVEPTSAATRIEIREID